MTRYEIRTVQMTQQIARYATINVSVASPCTPDEIDMPILEYSADGRFTDIVDGFHRIAGMAAAEVSEFPAVVVTCGGDDGLVATAAISGGKGQGKAIEEIYRLAESSAELNPIPAP